MPKLEIYLDKYLFFYFRKLVMCVAVFRNCGRDYANRRAALAAKANDATDGSANATDTNGPVPDANGPATDAIDTTEAVINATGAVTDATDTPSGKVVGNDPTTAVADGRSSTTAEGSCVANGSHPGHNSAAIPGMPVSVGVLATKLIADISAQNGNIGQSKLLDNSWICLNSLELQVLLTELSYLLAKYFITLKKYVANRYDNSVNKT